MNKNTIATIATTRDRHLSSYIVARSKQMFSRELEQYWVSHGISVSLEPWDD